MTKEKIKEKALNLFAANGYDGTSLENIAKEVGIKKASIYSHFKTKEEIFLSIVDDALNSDIEALKKIWIQIETYDMKNKLYTIFKYYENLYGIESGKKEVVFMKRTMLFPPLFLKEVLKQKFKKYEKSLNSILVSIFEEGIEKKVIKQIAIEDLLASFYCLIDGMFVEWHYYARKEYACRVHSIWNLFWNGVENDK